MITTELQKRDWGPFFDNMSKRLEGKQAEIEVASLEIGNQVEAEWLELIGIDYDPKDDLIEVALSGVDHLIEHPKQVRVAQDSSGLTSIEIVDAEGRHQLVKLKSPMMLPAPKH